MSSYRLLISSVSGYPSPLPVIPSNRLFHFLPLISSISTRHPPAPASPRFSLPLLLLFLSSFPSFTFTFIVKQAFPHSSLAVPFRYISQREHHLSANSRLFAQILVSFSLFNLLGFHLFFIIFIGQAAIFIEHPFRHFDLVTLSHRCTHLTRRVHKSQFPIA